MSIILSFHGTFSQYISNLGLAGGQDMLNAFMNAGVLPAASALLSRSQEMLAKGADSLDKNTLEHVNSAIESAISLIWLLWYIYTES